MPKHSTSAGTAKASPATAGECVRNGAALAVPVAVECPCGEVFADDDGHKLCPSCEADAILEEHERQYGPLFAGEHWA